MVLSCFCSVIRGPQKVVRTFSLFHIHTRTFAHVHAHTLLSSSHKQRKRFFHHFLMTFHLVKNVDPTSKVLIGRDTETAYDLSSEGQFNQSFLQVKDWTKWCFFSFFRCWQFNTFKFFSWYQFRTNKVFKLKANIKLSLHLNFNVKNHYQNQFNI